MATLWAERFAERTREMRASAVRELLKLTEHPDVISFGGGLPAPELFAIERFEAACRQVLSTMGRQALQYGTTEGYGPLREFIARRASGEGMLVEPKHVLITSGSQQALDLIGKVFLDRGDRVIIERPTYLGALQAWRAYQAGYLAIDVDEDGMDTNALRAALDRGAKFVYVLPNFQNPTGVTLSLARRQALVRLAERARMPIVEDNPYGELRYEGEDLPSLAVLDACYRGADCLASDDSHVLSLGSFSKTLAPGLRLGWVIAPVGVIERLVQAKQGADLHTSTFTQIIAHEILSSGFLDEHIPHIRAVYRARRDTMLAALAESFPDEVAWTRPAGGLFLWVTLPEGIDAAELLHDALGEKVAFVPGTSFFADGTGRNTLRLNFSYVPPPRIQEGIRRLGRVLGRRLAAVHQ